MKFIFCVIVNTKYLAQRTETFKNCPAIDLLGSSKTVFISLMNYNYCKVKCQNEPKTLFLKGKEKRQSRINPFPNDNC